MIRKDIDIHLEALAGYLNDEDKLVTYKWLSKELGIHVNLSKQILFEYWESRRKEKQPVSATFLLIGELEDGGGMRVEVVKEADLPMAKKKLGKIISEHVYSLQKTLPEIELLAIADKGDSQQSAVRCSESVIRSEHEMEVLRWGSILPVKNAQNTTIPKTVKKTDEPKLNGQQNNGRESTAKTTGAVKPAETARKGAFNNLFAKAKDKQNKEKDKAPASEKKSKQTSAKNSGATSSLKNAWFEAAKRPKNAKEQPESSSNSRVDEKADFEAKKRTESEREEPECSGEPKFEAKSDNIGKRESPGEIIDPGKTSGKKKSTSSTRGKKRQSSAKREGNSKRRKRIVVVESSEESGDSEIEDIEEDVPDSPDEPQITEKVKTCPSPPLVKREGGRRKVRKLVDKTFMDDDGYFVTQKEYVYESCSDKEEEMEVEVVKSSIAESTAKTSNKRKQATLLNFFKKS